MKKNIKMILAIVITAIICISGTVYATTKYWASDVTYKNTTVDKALDELYIERTINKTYDVKVNGEGNNASGDKFEQDKKYLCFLHYRNDVNNLSVDGAELISYNYDGGYLDYKYATEVAYIKTTSNTVKFTVSGSRGIISRCWKV